MGPATNYIGREVPAESFIWQDPVPAVNHPLVNARQVKALKADIAKSGLSNRDLVFVAWSSASTFRGSDNRGGANGARIQLEPMRSWECNNPDRLGRVLAGLKEIQASFNAANAPTQISLADLIVLAGNHAVEQAAAKAGVTVDVPFTPGRTDATQENTDVNSFAVLEPMADGFRNYQTKEYTLTTEELLVDKAQLLTLTAPEMTVLVGGMRALNANVDGNAHGVFTNRPGTLSNDFFVNLLDISTKWEPTDETELTFVGRDRATGEERWTATRADLIFGSNSELRALAEVYGSSDADAKFVNDFVAAWTKVMNLDRFDLLASN
jgi:catalase-peroxidase